MGPCVIVTLRVRSASRDSKKRARVRVQSSVSSVANPTRRDEQLFSIYFVSSDWFSLFVAKKDRLCLFLVAKQRPLRVVLFSWFPERKRTWSMATIDRISSVQPREIECRSVFENIGGRGNSAIFNPMSEVKSPFSVRAPGKEEDVGIWHGNLALKYKRISATCGTKAHSHLPF